MLKYKWRYALQKKTSWHKGLKSLTDNLISLQLRGNKLEIPDSKNEPKQNRYEFPSGSSVIERLEDFKKMTRFYKSFCPFFSKSLHIHSFFLNMFLLYYCLMVWSWLQMMSRLLENVLKKEMYGGIRSLRISSIFEIFQISLTIKKSIKFSLFFISKFKFD